MGHRALVHYYKNILSYGFKESNQIVLYGSQRVGLVHRNNLSVEFKRNFQLNELVFPVGLIFKKN